MKLSPLVVMVVILCVVVAIVDVSWAETKQPAAPAEAQGKLAKRIEQLERELAVLSGIVEGTAKPINLGRTSLATVSASSVNARRALDDKHYGVVNAFDDGNNWHNNINYTYWLSSGGIGQWVEVHFEQPVTVASIHVEFGGAAWSGYSARFTFAKGGQKIITGTGNDLNLSEPAYGVKAVRLYFAQSAGNLQVNEIRIMGHVGPDVKFKAQRPRILINKYNASAIATAQYEQWRLAFASRCNSDIQETDKQFIITYSIGGQDVLQVSVNKADGTVTRKALVKLVPIDPVAQIKK